MTTLELHAKSRVGQGLGYYAFDLQSFFFDFLRHTRPLRESFADRKRGLTAHITIITFNTGTSRAVGKICDPCHHSLEILCSLLIIHRLGRLLARTKYKNSLAI